MSIPDKGAKTDKDAGSKVDEDPGSKVDKKAGSKEVDKNTGSKEVDKTTGSKEVDKDPGSKVDKNTGGKGTGTKIDKNTGSKGDKGDGGKADKNTGTDSSKSTDSEGSSKSTSSSKKTYSKTTTEYEYEYCNKYTLQNFMETFSLVAGTSGTADVQQLVEKLRKDWPEYKEIDETKAKEHVERLLPEAEKGKYIQKEGAGWKLGPFSGAPSKTSSGPSFTCSVCKRTANNLFADNEFSFEDLLVMLDFLLIRAETKCAELCACAKCLELKSEEYRTKKVTEQGQIARNELLSEVLKMIEGGGSFD